MIKISDYCRELLALTGEMFEITIPIAVVAWMYLIAGWFVLGLILSVIDQIREWITRRKK